MGEKSGSLWLIVVVVVVVAAVLAILVTAFPGAVDQVMDGFTNTLNSAEDVDFSDTP